ncbi:MAG: polysaccharide deacetylase family protein, partial [Bacteroidota bacterium]
MTSFILLFTIVVILALLFLVVEYGFLVPAVKGLPILMYHKVSENVADGLTVKTEDLERQFSYIRSRGYSSMTFEEFAQTKDHQDKREKRIILTFDDAYESFYDHVLPLLEKYRLKATLFVPIGFIGKTNEWNKGSYKILDADKLKKLAENDMIELWINSFFHKNY